MKRTRKWAFVKQEAQRLADLGLSGAEIARQVEVTEASVSRWLSSGKLKRGRVQRIPAVASDRTPAQWAADVRSSYSLDSTDEQLVTMAESALLVSRDSATPAQLRLQAMGRFQAIVKQLALVARRADVKQDEAPKRAVVVRSGTDPRGILTGVN